MVNQKDCFALNKKEIEWWMSHNKIDILMLRETHHRHTAQEGRQSREEGKAGR